MNAAEAAAAALETAEQERETANENLVAAEAAYAEVDQELKDAKEAADLAVAEATEALETAEAALTGAQENLAALELACTPPESVKFTVKFALDGGKGEFVELQVGEDGSVTIPNTIPTRDGYKFLGWYANYGPDAQAFALPVSVGGAAPVLPMAGVKGPLLQPGAKFTPTGNVTLEAQWELLPPTPGTGTAPGGAAGVAGSELPKTGATIGLVLIAGLTALGGGVALRSRRK